MASADTSPTVARLRKRLKSLPEDFPDDVWLRVYRAIRWLWRAKMECLEDPDARFIFCWIAFNAAYARRLPGEYRSGGASDASEEFNDFFMKVNLVDQRKVLGKYVLSAIPATIEAFVQNRYVYWRFWRHHNGDAGYGDWEKRLDDDVWDMKLDMNSGETARVLSKLFDRLYALRNQLVHGGATWASSVNREQVEDAASIMEYTVPVFLDLMMTSPTVFNDGVPHYPVVGNTRTGRSHLDLNWPMDRCFPPCEHLTSS